MSGIQQLLLGGSPAGGYQIERSLRFNSADSAYLNRTPASAGNRKTWTWSGWVKRSASGTSQLFAAGVDNDDARFGFSSDNLYWVSTSGGATSSQFRTLNVYRDYSAWYHIVLVFDTTQATSTNRIKVYVNNQQATSDSGQFTAPTLNSDNFINSASVAHYIARYWSGSYFSGYLTEINFIDGQALTPSSFGQSDPNTGVWSPIKYTGTYGTNGFYLNFADNSNTTAATLGKDSSGNGNNWTPNLFSVTAGAGNDSLVDTPTSYGTDTGAGGEVRGNYCTMNPLTTTAGTYTQGNLRYVGASGWRRSNATIPLSTGKWYWEVTLGTAPYSPRSTSTSYNAFGFGLSTVFNSTSDPTAATDAVYLADNGWYKNFSGSWTDGGTAFSNGDTLAVAVDLGANTFTFYRNNTQITTGTIGGTAGRELVPIILSYDGTYGVMDCNFGQRPFASTAPSGFKALCTQNLPTPTIGATSTTQANDYFDVSLYTGTGSSLNITGLQFQPDFVWIKGRSGATDHGLYDAVRGVQKQIESNTTTAETTETTGLTAFNSDGFTVGALAQLNTNTATYVGWNWKANGAGSSNTAGTITSTVSANTTAGFSIVTYTASGSTFTVGHGLGVAPSMVLHKQRNNGVNDWLVYHTSLGTNSYLRLNTTAASSTLSGLWTTSSTTFGCNSAGTNPTLSGDHVFYCFAAVAGYSAFGSYTGNGSTDGPFVYTGFRPRFVIIKSTTSVDSWVMLDTSRDTYNVANKLLYPNLSNSEATFNSLDFNSNGFKQRNTDTAQNANGSTYIYAAFAENPFKYSLAR